ncbi:MAG TPA: glycosyltransferase family 4 protein [Candidatus Baltobacteraceae bacterium]|nr:glycosyltransferase family 4 protein [Candidatus Baltobacteraceae bacterium]
MPIVESNLFLEENVNEGPKVCLLTNTIPPYYLSVFEHLRNLVGGLRIFVSTAVEGGRNWKPKWGDLPVTVQKSWTYPTHKRYAGGFTLEFWRRIPYDTLPLLIRERPEVVISLQLGFRTLQAAIYRKLFPKSRLIVWNALSEHTEKGLPAWRVLQRKVLLRAADAVLVDGASGMRYLQSLGVPPERIFPLPYCGMIAPHLELPLERDPSVARRLLYVGRLIDLKGLMPFLTILSCWLRNHPGNRCEFWIAGDGPLRTELEKFPSPPELQLRFLGNVAYEKLPEVYWQGGIFAFPTLADEWGVVVNEAMAAGLPVLGSRYSQAVEELVTEGVHGWTFRPDHPEEMYAALDRAMTARLEELHEMRGSCRERILPFVPQYGAKYFHAAIDFVRPRDGAGDRPPKVSAESSLGMDAARGDDRVEGSLRS